MPPSISYTQIDEIVIFIAIALLFLLIGALLNQKLTRRTWLQEKLGHEQQSQIRLSELQQELEYAQQNIDNLKNEISLYQSRIEEKGQQLGMAQAQASRVSELENQIVERERKQMEVQLALSKSHAIQQTMTAQFQAEQKALQEKVITLEAAETRLKTQFEHLAHKIFEDRSDKMQQQNANQLDGILAPLKQQLEGFRQQIRESYQTEQSERITLKTQLEQLQQLNLKMSQDAINLTKALKGDNKQQGNWGEVVLSRVLQESGLREGHEYSTQANLKSDAGKSFKPDVIVHLPDNKDVVIDAKMSLLAYEKFFNSDDEATKLIALKDHVSSIRNHIKGLSQKDYHQLHGLKSLDYVLMFIPVEPAFLTAIQEDPSLVSFAMEQNIMLVSPTNLLVALRTIHNIWRYEYQNQHAQLIAKQAGKIYDKLCGYVDDMDKLGRNLDNANKSYLSAMNKLSQGKGNLIRQAHQMQQLGINNTKKLNKDFIEQSLNENFDELLFAEIREQNIPQTNEAK